MRNFIIELALPRTNAGVYGQTIVMAVVWVLVISVVVLMRARSEYRTFAVGLAVLNFAWFAARTVH